jgi:hypothetical protein
MAGAEEEREFRLGWSLWRRAHQAVARRCHSANRDLLRARQTDANRNVDRPKGRLEV